MANRVISAVLTFKDENFSSGLRKANKQAGDFGREINVVQNKVESFAKSATEKFKAVGVAAGALAVGAVAGLAGAVGKSILDMDSSFAQLQAQTGLMGTEMESLKQSAIDTFKRGYGESLDEVTEAVARVKQNMHNLDNGEIANVTSNALLLAKTFDSDVNEVTRGVNNMMESFGVSAEKAFDLFTKGGQSGLNFSNEMFDNVAEYSSLFGAMGYSAEEYFGILSRGAQEGVYNLDYVNDVMKEFQIRLKDNSDSTSDAMSVMSQKTLDLWEAQYQGKATVADVAQSVIKDLKGMENQVDANEIGVALFGTKWEDLESKAMYAMLGSTEAMKDFEGTTAAAAESVEGGFVNRLKSSFRDLTTSVASLSEDGAGKEFLDSIATTAENLVPKITSVANKAMEFGNTIRDNWGPIKETVIGITTAIVAFQVGMTAMTIVSTVTGFIKAYRAAVAAGTVAQWAMNTAMSANPVGLVITGIAALIAIGVVLYRNWDTVKEKAVQLWGIIRSNPITAFLTQPIQNAINFGVMLYQNWDIIKASAITLWTTIKEKFVGIKDAISSAIQPVLGWFQNLSDKWNNFKSAISNFKVPDWVSKLGGGAVGWVMDKVNGSHANGLNYVPYDGYVAELHKGEMVIPARESERLRQQGANIGNVDRVTSSNTVTTNNSNSTNNINVNIHAKGVTASEVLSEVVPQLKLVLANM